MVMIEVTASDPVKVSKTLPLVTREADVTVREMQRRAGVPDSVMVASFVVSPPSTPAAAMPSRTRSTIVIFGAGVGLSVLLTVAVDVFLTRRKSRALERKLARADETTGTGPTKVPDDVVARSKHTPATEGAVEAK
jgi:hypothetical protein